MGHLLLLYHHSFIIIKGSYNTNPIYCVTYLGLLYLRYYRSGPRTCSEEEVDVASLSFSRGEQFE
jgi:hypothetical protein